MSPFDYNTYDPLAMWAVAAKRIAKYTDEERRQSFIDAGILTKSGNIAAPYKGVFKKIKKAPAKKKPAVAR